MDRLSLGSKLIQHMGGEVLIIQRLVVVIARTRLFQHSLRTK